MSRLWRGPVVGMLACAVVLCAATSGAAAAGVRFLDGGVLDASPAKRAAAASASASAGPQELIKLSQKIDIEGKEYFYSGPLSFDWTSDTVSVLLYQEPRPSEAEILIGLDTRRPERAYSLGASAGFVLPGADAPVANGTYGFEIAATVDSAEVFLLRRRGPQPTAGTVDLNLFVLEGAGLEDAFLDQAAGLLAQTFAEARIRVGTVTHYVITGAEDLLSVPADTSAGSLLRQVTPISSLAANPMACNIFFVREITDDEEGGGLFGVSLGVPAALTIPGTISSGVVINVSAHQTAGGFDGRELGQTITHETGHSLGLYHTSEQDAALHDTISDTPECVGAEPLDAAGCPDGTNFMFWSGRDFAVTPGQSYVMLRSPVVR